MSWRASAYFKALKICRSGERITRSEKLVGLVLADSHQDRSNTYTFPSVEGIAEDSLMSERECRRVLGSLERKGEIVRVRPAVQYRGISVFYLFPGLDTLPEAQAQRKGDILAPLPEAQAQRKGDILAPLPETQAQQKGGQKGDRRGTKSTPYKEEPEQEQIQKQLPEPPTALGGGLASPVQGPERRDGVRVAVQKCQRHRLGVTIWPPAADRALLALLRCYPEDLWPLEKLVECIQFRFASDLDPAEPPQKWLGDLPEFISGAKDRFKRPKSIQKHASIGEVVSIRGRFTTAAVCLIESQPEQMRLQEGRMQLVKEKLCTMVGPAAFSTWIDPLMFAFVNDKNKVIVLAPSMDWEGIQEKYSEKINKVISDNGLTNGFELWFMNRDGGWSEVAA